MSRTPEGKRAPAQESLLYPGLIVAVIFISLALGSGSSSSAGLFLPYMAGEFGWSRVAISGAVALFPLVTGLLQPAVGWLVQRISPLLVLAAGGSILGAALLLTHLTSQPWHLLASYGLLGGIGVSAASLVVAAALINVWFTRRRGLALGLASAGLSAGKLVLVPAAGWLILTLGWRPAWSVLGILVLIGPVLAVTLFLFRPGGREHPTAAGAAAPPSGAVNWWRHGSFWRLAGSFCVCGFTVHLFTMQLPSFALERGLSGTTVAMALGAGSGLAALGTVAMGWLADFAPQRQLLALAYFVRAAGFAGIVLSRSPLLFIAMAVLAGSTFLVTGNLTVGLTGNAFGIARAPYIFGFTYVGHQLSGTVSMLLGGLSYDLTGTYAWAFGLAVVLLLLAALTAYGFAERPQTRSAAIAAP